MKRIQRERLTAKVGVKFTPSEAAVLNGLVDDGPPGSTISDLIRKAVRKEYLTVKRGRRTS